MKKGFIFGILVLVSFGAIAQAPSFSIFANNAFGTSQINGIAYGNEKFVAVGNDGKIAYSN